MTTFDSLLAAKNNEEKPIQHAGVHAGAASLSVSDRQLINALGAYQLRYGKAEEALALLQLSNRLWPDDQQTLRLLTQAFILAGDYQAADMTEQALQRVTGPVRPGRLDLLRQAFVHFGCKRFPAARSAIIECLRLHKDEQA